MLRFPYRLNAGEGIPVIKKVTGNKPTRQHRTLNNWGI